jgi:peroxiredoxin
MCREHVVRVRDDYAKFQQAGGEVVVVTMGSPAQTARFRERYQLPFPVLSDPQQRAYQAFAVPRGSLAQVAGPGMWLGGLKSLFRAGIGVPQGDPYQLQAAFVVDREGVVQYAHRPRNSVDQPDHDAMLAALRR